MACKLVSLHVVSVGSIKPEGGYKRGAAWAQTLHWILNKHGGMVKWLSSISGLDEYFVTKAVPNLP